MEVDYKELNRVSSTTLEIAKQQIEEDTGERIEDLGLTDRQIERMIEQGFLDK